MNDAIDANIGTWRISFFDYRTPVQSKAYGEGIAHVGSESGNGRDTSCHIEKFKADEGRERIKAS
jgi:hypothetical protein